MRIDDYKFTFIGQPQGWLGEKIHMDVPNITNLHLDPFERMGWPGNGTKDGAQAYFEWFKYEFWRFVFVQQVVGKALQTFIEFPPMQHGAELQPRCRESRNGETDGPGRGGKQGSRPLTSVGLVARSFSLYCCGTVS